MERVGQCPRCSAPLYLPEQGQWPNGVPPKVTYTCECPGLLQEQMRRSVASPPTGMVGRATPSITFPPK